MGLAIVGGSSAPLLALFWRRWDCLGVVSGSCVGFFAGYLFGTARLLEGDELKNVLVIFILFLFQLCFG